MALTQVDQGLLGTYAQYTGFKNRIINGQMVIDQRNAGNVVTPSSGNYALDRWKVGYSNDGAVSVQQTTTVPNSGFKNSMKFAVTTADTSIAAGQYFQFIQAIEGYNVADLNFGSSYASSVTISFWVNSSKTGTYCATLFNNAANRLCPLAFTVNSASTWEQKTITVAGDTSGTWTTDNSAGLNLAINLALGSNYNTGTSGTWNTTQYGTSSQVNWMDTLGATFYITGVQLEKGSTATSFDYRPYGTELQLCQRYYETSRGTTATFTQAATIAYPVFVSDTNRTSGRQFTVAKRSAPTVTIYSRNNTSGKVSTVSSGTDNAGTASVSSISETGWSNTVIGTATTAGVGIEVAYAADSEL